MNDNIIISKKASGGKIAVLAPTGKWASPYRVEGRALVKRVTEQHIFRAKQAIGIDESVWQSHREHVDVVRFLWWDGRIFEILAEEFEQKSFVHGDGLSFAVTRFVPISALKIVQERPPVRGQLALFAGVGV
jgi:hypothetical protein